MEAREKVRLRARVLVRGLVLDPASRATRGRMADSGAKKAGKTLGRRGAVKSAPVREEKPKKAAKAEKAKKGSKPAVPGAPPELLGAHEKALVEALAERTRLSPREVISRALSAYAAAVAPALSLPAAVRAQSAEGVRLFMSVDGRPELEIPPGEFVLGSAEGVDLRLDLPLIAPRHARVLWRDGQPLFEDLRSPRGSFRHGQPVDVRMLETGDEIDLGGFLPLRFRLA